MHYLRARRPLFKNGVRAGSSAGAVALPDSPAELRLLAMDAEWCGLPKLVGLVLAEAARLEAREAEVVQLRAAQAAQAAQIGGWRARWPLRKRPRRSWLGRRQPLGWSSGSRRALRKCSSCWRACGWRRWNN